MDDLWCTIESDPAVFTELIEAFGVQDVEVEEVYDFFGLAEEDPASILGLIFLFKWQAEEDPRSPILEPSADLFFAKQVISNACATQAILSVLLNAPLELGPELESFRQFAQHLPYDLRGEALGHSSTIREAHNSFARPEPFVLEEQGDKDSSDAFHFISYVPIGPHLYELDGLKAGPFLLDEGQAGGNWLHKVVPLIQERISKYQSSEIRFNLLALVKSRRSVLLKEEQRLQGELERLEQEVASSQGPSAELEELQTRLFQVSEQLADTRSDLEREHQKHQRYARENQRRRFNYIPMVFELLKALARKGKLEGLYQEAQKRRGASGRPPH